MSGPKLTGELAQAKEFAYRKMVEYDTEAEIHRSSAVRYGYVPDAPSQWHREQGDALERKAMALQIQAQHLRTLLAALNASKGE